MRQCVRPLLRFADWAVLCVVKRQSANWHLAVGTTFEGLGGLQGLPQQDVLFQKEFCPAPEAGLQGSIGAWGMVEAGQGLVGSQEGLGAG